MKYKENNKRIWELDFLRGLALVLMVYYHILFDLSEFFHQKLFSVNSGINPYIGKASALLFIVISGISSSLSDHNIKRGKRIIAAALLITFVTHVAGRGYGIKFGILHLLGVCILFCGLLKRLPTLILALLGTLFIAMGPSVSSFSPNNDLLFFLGIRSSRFVSWDFYPLIPWSGFFLYGIFFGKLLYSPKKSLIKLQFPDNPVNTVGQHTLVIYLLHQPIILGLLYLLKME